MIEIFCIHGKTKCTACSEIFKNSMNDLVWAHYSGESPIAMYWNLKAWWERQEREYRLTQAI